jgi:hypothetical protein
MEVNTSNVVSFNQCLRVSDTIEGLVVPWMCYWTKPSRVAIAAACNGVEVKCSPVPLLDLKKINETPLIHSYNWLFLKSSARSAQRIQSDCSTLTFEENHWCQNPLYVPICCKLWIVSHVRR